MTYSVNESWTPVVPDYMPEFRTFLRSQPQLAALHSGRVYFRAPEQGKTGYPYVRLYLINSVMPNPNVPDIQVRLGVHVWGNVDSMYTQVRALMNAIISTVWSVNNGRLVAGGETYVYSAGLVSDMDLPDPETGWPRRVASTIWYLRMAGTADP